MTERKLTLPLEVGKEYTWVNTNGEIFPVRIICIDRQSPAGHSVVALINFGKEEDIRTFNPSGDCGYVVGHLEDKHDPLDDLKIDDRVWVKDSIGELWQPRHYAGKNNMGKHIAWAFGCTSFTQYSGDGSFTPWEFMIPDTGTNPNEETK